MEQVVASNSKPDLSSLTLTSSTSVSDLLQKFDVIPVTGTGVTISEFKAQLSQKIKNIIGAIGGCQESEGNSVPVYASNNRFAGILRHSLKSKSHVSGLTPEVEDYFLETRLPAEGLNFTIELRNSVETETGLSGSSVVKKSNSTLEDRNKSLILNTANQLFEKWAESNCLAEALVQFSISDTNLAETANLSRNLFSVPTKFHVSREEFPSFILQQLLLTVETVSQLIRRNQIQNTNTFEVRTQFLSSILDRLFLRFHTDQENFYPYFEESIAQGYGSHNNLQDAVVSSRLNGVIAKDPFVNFVIDASQLVEGDFIARRLLGKILLGLGQNPVNKIAKTVILTETFCNCRATKILYPPEEFLFLKNETWKHVLLLSIPLKTQLHNLPFFVSWANLLLISTVNRSIVDLVRIWKSLCVSWTQLMTSSYTDGKTIVCSTCALICLCKAIKDSSSWDSFKDSLTSSSNLDLEPNDTSASAIVPIFQGVQTCLGSTDREKQACGMAVGQIVANLISKYHSQNSQNQVGQPPVVKTEDETLARDILQPPTATAGDGVSSSLRFESEHPLFHQLVNFYQEKIGIGKEDNTLHSGENKIVQKLQMDKIVPRNLCGGLMAELDSDDDVDMDIDDDDVVEGYGDGDMGHIISSNSTFKPYDMSDDTPVPDSLLNLRGTDKKIPVYISDICEILLESSGCSSKDEAAAESLKQIAVMKIPILLSHQIRIDSTIAKDLARALAELDSGSLLEIPIICGLHEMSIGHPIQVFQTLGQLAFDKSHYSSGHRMAILARYTEVIQLLSKQKCFSCFSEKTGKLDKILERIHPPFIRDYMVTKRAQRKCGLCNKIDGAKIPKPRLDGGNKNVKEKAAEVKAKDAGDSISESSSNKIETESEQKTEPTSEEESKLVLALPWREVIQRRIDAKTRRFGTSNSRNKSKQVVDVYSAKLVPIVWASIANKLLDEENLSAFLNSQHADSLSFALFTAQAFRTLGITVLGTSGIFCPHLRNIAAQTADLVSTYSHHADAQVRRAVLSLLATILASSESKEFIVEIFLSSSYNLFEQLQPVYEKDIDTENRHLFAKLRQLATASAMVHLGKSLQQ